MASFLQRLVRKQPLTTTLITNLNTRILSSPTHLPDPPAVTIPLFKTLPKPTDESNPHHHSSTVYPCFSFDTFLHPISETGYVQSEEDVGIWADSVKKKRKKKMNKHKLKKLRKRLRRKT